MRLLVKDVQLHGRCVTTPVENSTELHEVVERFAFTVYYFGGMSMTLQVPVGYKTDFASIPRFLWWLWPPSSPKHLHASVCHDYLLTDTRVPRFISDIIFRKILKAKGNSVLKRRIFYIGVTLGTLREKLCR